MRVGWVGLLGLLSTTTGLAAPPEPDVVVRPGPAPGPLDNPLKGWCPYADAGPIRQPYPMVFGRDGGAGPFHLGRPLLSGAGGVPVTRLPGAWRSAGASDGLPVPA